MSSTLKYLIIGIFLIVGGYFLYQFISWQVENNKKSSIFIDLETLKPDWVDQRMGEQKKAAANYKVFHDFQFTNEIERSKITFQHLSNPDGGKTHKPVHYDHGNGLTIADVDNDGLHDIYFVSQVGKGELWRNLGNGQFEDITAKSGLDVTGSRSCVSASFADIDNDGDADLAVSVIRDGNLLFENQGGGVFKDISKSAKVDFHSHASGICFLDFNKDGLLDIFETSIGVYTTGEKREFEKNGKKYSYWVGVKDGFAGHLKPERFEKSILYQNMGNNVFKNVTSAMGIDDHSWCGDAVAFDPNDDGYPDLYVTNMQGLDEYYENDGGKRFIKKSREIFPNTSWGSMGVDVFDFDNDGLQDLYVTDMHSDMGENSALGLAMEKIKRDAFPQGFLKANGANIAGNSFFKKTGKNQYKEISDNINAENYWPWGISTADINADGFVDVFVSKSMNYPFRYTENLILLNENGKQFLDSEYVLGIEPRANNAYAKPWFELDCDGADKDHADCHNKTGTQTIYGALGTRSSVVFDFDNDGDLDVVTNEYNDKPMFLVSNLSDKKELNFLKVKLQGTTSNRDGLGATVIVKAGKDTYTKVYNGKSGYLAHSSYPLYFGLGENKKVDSIAVKWPSGITQVLQPTEIGDDKTLLIVEGE